MGMFDHWQAVMLSSGLRRKPVSVRVAGRDIALFRTSAGQIGALDDQCPHRRMRLSVGQVVNDKLMCIYHGWTFDCAGSGESPGTPKMHACVGGFDTREEHGMIWIKSRESTPVFPKLDVDGWCWMCTTEHYAKAPLELTLDNFCEIEHTPTTHDLFGYQLDRMNEVTVRVETTDSSVTVINHGPPKPINRVVRHLIGLKKGFVFKDVWTTYFSPVYAVFDHAWIDPNTQEEAKVKWRVYVFFTPVSDMETRFLALTYAKSSWPFLPQGGLPYARWYMKSKVIHELELDANLLAQLACYDTHMEGMKLSRFDKALMCNRERLNKIYRGNDDSSKRALQLAAHD